MYTLLKKCEPKVLQILENSKKNNRLSHVYLFSGPKGTLKKEMAFNFAAMIYCDHDHPCYECENCRAIIENRHLNVFYIEPFGQNIKKEQVLALQDEFSKTSLIEGPRIYIINEAETMSTQAANSLLKFIEEPNPDIYGILITDDIDSMLPTIISRSINIKFDPIDKNILRDDLLLEGIDSFTVDSLVYLSNNKKDALAILESDSKCAVIELIDKFIKQLKASNIGLFYRANYDVFANKENVLLFMYLLEALYRDMYETYVSSKVLVFKSKEDEIKELAKNYRENDLLMYLELILDFEKKLKYNVNISLLFNGLLIDLKGGRL